MIGTIGIIVSLSLLIFLVFKGWSILGVSMIATVLVALTSGLDLWEALSVHLADGIGSYVASYFLIFVLGAFFGEIMSKTGSAKAIANKLLSVMGAKRAPLALVLATLILTYGGINSFIVVFTLYPIAVVLFKEANLPRSILVTSIMLGVGTITQSAFPGTPSIQNLIPTEFFGTTAYAAPILGIIASILFFIIGMTYIQRLVKKAQANNAGFIAIPQDNLGFTGSVSNDSSDGTEGSILDKEEEEKLPDWKIAVIPIIIVIVMIFILSLYLPAIFAVSLSITTSILLTYLLNWNRIDDPILIMNDGLKNGIMPLLNTAFIVGYGSVVQATPAFQELIHFITTFDFNPYVTGVFGVNLIAGITGSSSGGLQIFLNNMGEHLIGQGAQPDLLHRILSVSSGGLDTLPHNGAVVSIFAVLGTTHKESYKSTFVVSVLAAVLVTIVLIGIIFLVL